MSCVGHQIARLLIDAELRRSAEKLQISSDSEEHRPKDDAIPDSHREEIHLGGNDAQHTPSVKRNRSH